MTITNLNDNILDKIVNSIIADIKNRQGIGSEWDYIDEGIKEEIKQEWKNTILDIIKYNINKEIRMTKEKD